MRSTILSHGSEIDRPDPNPYYSLISGCFSKCRQCGRLRLGEARCAHLFMNPNPLRFNDPQTPLRRLSFKNSQGGTQQRQCVFDTLRVWAQDPYPMVTCWWVYADIREVEIERDENPLLFLRGTEHTWIGVASQLLSEHGMDIMTGLLK